MKLVYTVEAVEDLKRLRQFIAEHNPAAAHRIAAELVAKIKLLADFPAIGVPVAMAPLPESLRDMVFGHYVVRYSVHSNAIIILRLWHSLENARQQ
ncbi:MAG: plasmid stabilization protein [Gammaproteobacteria bacterium HGW-Gammaproteobacteria-15]|nr:MAG: plasmid stabilization protein [Gammaproteobacteria bacterium HGW-Gammaproteobacteria-15]